MQGVLEPAADVAVATADVAPRPGRVTLTATAPGLPAVADWIDVVSADPRFAELWASGFIVATQPDGSTAVQFSMEMIVTAENLVDRSATTEVQP
jgi:hypothetical protein